MTAADLVGRLQARGVALRAEGDRLRLRPAGAVSSAELEALRRHKSEILRLLAVESPRPAAATAIAAHADNALASLAAGTLAEVCGPDPSPHVVAGIAWDVRDAIREIRAGIASGTLPPRRIVAGRPLADWLPLEALAVLLRDGGVR